ncbi:MAG: metallophosphoesterase [Alphaproteobacteria bacterium]|nr:metallophosphoesterase [Alphaproteobacteria bacterium]MBQ9234843.1 metallophosphoesterase [Alphaproteobacteria bacterium]
MPFLLIYLVIAAACSAITIKNLIGYGEVRRSCKIAVSIVVVLGWFGSLPVYWIKKYNLLNDTVYGVVSSVLYFMLAFVFVLFVLIMLRDILWFVFFQILKLTGHTSWSLDPNNEEVLSRANIVGAILALLICFYASYQGSKLPVVAELNVSSDKITSNLKIVQISDLHLERNVSRDKVKNLVDFVNSLNPDVVVLTGDIINDEMAKVSPLLYEMRAFSAPYGAYSVMGDNEFDNNVYDAKKAFDENGIPMLFNGGKDIKVANIFIAGVPDYSTMSERINLWRTIYKSKKENYRVLLSHSPLIIDALSKDVFDMVLSGHTHGGQFYPFHWIVEKMNSYLAGHYIVNGIDLFVSRGVGAWGPKMRLGAPADIAVINLRTK